jgi:MFS family permease
VREYAVVTGAYWVFTITDGALRMLVLLYLNELGYQPLEIASLFLFYEFFGIVTNLVGGFLGARFGLKTTLFAGLALQIAATSMLAANAAALTVPFVMLTQVLSGIAKDLTKMSSKSYVKLVIPDEGLMKWIAVLTGSKNALKGAGFFVGAALLALVGFQGANIGMAVALGVTLVAALALLPQARGKAKSKVKLSELISRDRRINWLSAARFFLFGSRDIWFVLAVPLFLRAQLGWSFWGVGAFLATWVIGYGFVQASAPAWVGTPTGREIKRATTALVIPLAAILGGLWWGLDPATTLMTGLALFGVVFAANSAIHSYLVVAYAERDKVSLAVGFYYMANAAGRLVGTLLSGALFQMAGQGRVGLMVCILGSMIFVVAARAFSQPLD